MIDALILQHHSGAFAGLNRNDYPELKTRIDADVKVAMRSIRQFFVPEMRMKRQIGFMAKHSIEGENWKARI